MRLISFAITPMQVFRCNKDVTRRNGWRHARVGQHLAGVLKAMGRKPGEKVVGIRPVVITAVSLQPLDTKHITQDECRREGFPDLTPDEFIALYRRHMKPTADGLVTRIAFRYLDLRELSLSDRAQWRKYLPYLHIQRTTVVKAYA